MFKEKVYDCGFCVGLGISGYVYCGVGEVVGVKYVVGFKCF